MSVENALAGVAVHDLETAAKWYEQLIGTAGKTPMPGLLEWSLPGGGSLQIFKDSKRAGSSSVTLSVTGLDDHIAQLSERGVKIGDRSASDKVSTAILLDPDGNQVVLAEQHTDKIAS
ncbi:VOC family protein [Thermomonas sp.]|uniref:VOC family protein n=1 Tax=Thermomonas sp. TaxID=1971895 RepID=UPI0024873507|nr:VOC family protein [Thermomonas sp.]MDI1253849.1 VOC family protein [Thermomonas sp.]